MSTLAIRCGLTTALLLSTSISFASLNEPIKPITYPTDIDQEKVALGKKLFFDPRLSKSGIMSCNSCHNLSMGGTDNIPTSVGHGWQQGPINSPTVLNATYNIAQFWDGRAQTLQDQAGGPIANPGEMASTHSLAIEVISSIPQYQAEFEQVFDAKGINIDQITSAIAEFEKTLVTPNSKFDRWLNGDENALNDREQDGYRLFKEKGCVACHNGVAVGGNSFQKMGLVKAFSTQNTSKGLAEVTGNSHDEFKFKVPTLRNIELTYPYFHDGSTTSLTEAVNVMADVQLGIKLTDQENDHMVAFLKTLTGDQPSFALPILPPSTERTPKPQPFE